MTKASDNPFPSLLITEGTVPTSPAAGKQRLYIDSTTHLVKVVNSGGTASNVGGSGTTVATDTIWDAAGDLAVGSGADTAARLAKGATAGMVLMMSGGSVVWKLPQGHELDYVEKTTDTSITATAEASADTVVTATATVFDGSTRIKLEFWAVQGVTSTNQGLQVFLFDGSSSIGLMSRAQDDAAQRSQIYCVRYFTPAAATKTYSIRAITGSGTATIGAGAGGTATQFPAFIRISIA